jgi:hypothetical protein
MANSSAIEYIKSNTWTEACEKDEEKRTAKKGLQVLYNNQLYYKHRNNNDFVYWRCVQAFKNAKCKGSVKISSSETVIAETSHSGHETLSEKEVSVLRFKVNRILCDRTKANYKTLA